MTTQPQTLPLVTIYTDGGCEPNPGLGAYAAILQFSKDGETHERTLSGVQENVNNQRMELMAVVAALESLKRPCAVTLFADSQYVVKGMTEWLPNWLKTNWHTVKGQPVKHADLWQRIHSATQTHQVQFVWVKGHNGHTENERVDALVRQARAQFKGATVTPEPVAVTPEPVAVTPEPVAVTPEPVAVTPEPVYRLLIAGSRRANQNMVNSARFAVQRAIAHGWEIVVGDNPEGVDAAVVQACRELGYSRVVVVGIADAPRNGGVGRYVKIGRTYAERDQLMAKASNRGLFLWDGQSSGTNSVARYMEQLGKTVHLFDFRTTFATA